MILGVFKGFANDCGARSFVTKVVMLDGYKSATKSGVEHYQSVTTSFTIRLNVCQEFSARSSGFWILYGVTIELDKYWSLILLELAVIECCVLLVGVLRLAF